VIVTPSAQRGSALNTRETRAPGKSLVQALAALFGPGAAYRIFGKSQRRERLFPVTRFWQPLGQSSPQSSSDMLSVEWRRSAALLPPSHPASLHQELFDGTPLLTVTTAELRARMQVRRVRRVLEAD
jgi:hypothetical protein